MKTPNTDFAAWLQQSIRERPDIKNQKALAERLDVYASTVHYWLKGTSEPDDTNIARLAGIFGVDKVFILRLLGKVPAAAFEDVILATQEAQIMRDLVDLRETNLYEPTVRAVQGVLDAIKFKADGMADCD